MRPAPAPLADSLRAVISDLVRIPAVNQSIAPDEPLGEAAVAAAARDWL
jgi:hypothetical protein